MIAFTPIQGNNMQEQIYQAPARFRNLGGILSLPLCRCKATTRAQGLVPLDYLVNVLRHVESIGGTGVGNKNGVNTSFQIEVGIDSRKCIIGPIRFSVISAENQQNLFSTYDDWSQIPVNDPIDISSSSTFLPFKILSTLDNFHFLSIVFATPSDPIDEIKYLVDERDGNDNTLLKAVIIMQNSKENVNLDKYSIYRDIFHVFILSQDFFEAMLKKQNDNDPEFSYELNQYKIFNDSTQNKLTHQAINIMNKTFKEVINVYIQQLKKSIYEHSLTYSVLSKQLKYKNLLEQQQQTVQHLQNSYGESILLRYAKLLIYHARPSDSVTDLVNQILTEYLTKYCKNNIYNSNLAFYLRCLMCICYYIECDKDETKTEFRSGFVFQIFYDAKSLLLQTNNEFQLLKKKYKGNWNTNLAILNKSLQELFSSETYNIFNAQFQDAQAKYIYHKNFNYKIFAELLYVIIFSYLYQEEHLPRQIQNQSIIEACSDMIMLLTKKDIPEYCFLKHIYYFNAYFWLKEYCGKKIKQCILIGMQIWQIMLKNIMQNSGKVNLKNKQQYVKLIENFGSHVSLPKTFTKQDPICHVFISCKLETTFLAYQQLLNQREQDQDKTQQSDLTKLKQLMRQYIHDHLVEKQIYMQQKPSNQTLNVDYFESKIAEDFILKAVNKGFIQNVIPYFNQFNINLFTFSDIQLARHGIMQNFSEFTVEDDTICFNINIYNTQQKYLYFGYNYIILEKQDLSLINPFNNNSYLQLEMPYHDKFKFPDDYKQCLQYTICSIEEHYDKTINKVAYHGKNITQMKYYLNDTIQIHCSMRNNFIISITLQIIKISIEFLYYQDKFDISDSQQGQQVIYNQEVDKICNNQYHNCVIQVPMSKLMEQLSKDIKEKLNQKGKMFFSIQRINFHTKQNHIINVFNCYDQDKPQSNHNLNFLVLKFKRPNIKIQYQNTSQLANEQVINLQISTDQQVKLIAHQQMVLNCIQQQENNETDYVNQSNNNGNQYNTDQNNKDIIKSQSTQFMHTDCQLWNLTNQGVYLLTELQRPMIILQYYFLLQQQILEKHGFEFLLQRKSISDVFKSKDQISQERLLNQKVEIYSPINKDCQFCFRISDINKTYSIYFVDENDIIGQQKLEISPKKGGNKASEAQNNDQCNLVFVKSVQNVLKFKLSLPRKEEISQVFLLSQYLLNYQISVLNGKSLLVQTKNDENEEEKTTYQPENKLGYFLNNFSVNLEKYNIVKLQDTQQYDYWLYLSSVFIDEQVHPTKLQEKIRETANFLYKTYDAAYKDTKDSDNFIKRANLKFQEDIEKVQQQFVTYNLNKTRYGHLIVITNNQNIITKKIQLPPLQQYKVGQQYIQTKKVNIKTFIVKNILSVYKPVIVDISGQQVEVNFGESKYLEVIETQSERIQN